MICTVSKVILIIGWCRRFAVQTAEHSILVLILNILACCWASGFNPGSVMSSRENHWVLLQILFLLTNQHHPSGLGHVLYLSSSGTRGSPFQYISISVPVKSRCHFWDHRQINFGTFLDHLGTKNFKHLVTLADVCSRPEHEKINVMPCQ